MLACLRAMAPEGELLKRTQVQLEEELYELLRQEAFERGMPISELVRSILRQHLVAGGKPQGSLGFVGMGESEQGSLAPISERHDETPEGARWG